jgi:hypothetical protein
MAGDDELSAGKHYVMGDVGDGARVIQGDHNTLIEAMRGMPGGLELRRQLDELLARIASDPDLDDDGRELATEKTLAVAVALGQASESPAGLRRALVDARVFLTSTAGWAWDGLQSALASEAAQKTIGSIAEASTRAAVQGLIGSS